MWVGVYAPFCLTKGVSSSTNSEYYLQQYIFQFHKVCPWLPLASLYRNRAQGLCHQEKSRTRSFKGDIFCQFMDLLSCFNCQVSCGKCGNGLGHEFLGDGPEGKSRFWIFSHSLKFVGKDSLKSDENDGPNGQVQQKCWG